VIGVRGSQHSVACGLYLNSEGYSSSSVRYHDPLSAFMGNVSVFRRELSYSEEYMAPTRKEMLFEGYSEEEILRLDKPTLESLILNGAPILFRAGSASILGE